MEAILGKGFKYPLKALKKHFVALGNTGSGKTVLSKVLVEEAALNGIPCIIVDPQGDIASLGLPADAKEVKEHSVDSKKLESYKKKVRVVVFTPTSSKGIPVCVNPLKLPKKGIDKEDLISILSQISESITQLIGYKLDQDKGKNAQAIIYLLLMDCWKKGKDLRTFDHLSSLVVNLPESVQEEGAAFTKNKKELEVLAKKLKYLTIGGKELLFQFGVQLDINTLLGKKQKGTQISIIYLNTLESMEEKQFFISMLGTNLYQWMLANPSKNLQAIFMIDEIAPFIPAGALKPMAKEILKLIFKQARKYGVGCVACTQNPGDIDYKAFAQFGTWAIGRLTVKQDVKKVEMALKSLAVKGLAKTISKLPKLKPGNFLFFCPDAFKEVKDLEVRWLLTEHKTLTDDDVKELTTQEIRSFYKPLMVSKPKKVEEVVEAKEVKEEKVEEKVVKLKKEKVEHFPIKISKEKISKTVDWKKKRLFILFGPESENLESLKLLLKPVIKTTIVKGEKGILGKKTKEAIVYFDGVDGNLLKIKKDGSMKSFDGMQTLLKLGEREISVFQLLESSKKGMTNAELAAKLGLTDSFVNQVTNSLMKKKIINHVKKAGRAFLWEPLTKTDIPSKLSYVSSEKPSLKKGKMQGQKIGLSIKIEDISKFVRAWFKASISEAAIIYYPYYEARLAGKKKRMIKLSAVNGRMIN